MDKTKLRRINIMISDEVEEKAKKKARKYLQTLPGNQQDSLSAAIRWCINNSKQS